MNKQKSWKRFFLGGVAATAVVASVAAFTLTPNIVSAQDAAPDSTVTEDGGRWFGGRGHGRSAGMMGHGMKDAGHGEHMAEALRITVDELAAAQTEAKDAAIAQLVEDRDALLADALGITVDELQAAKDAAHEAGLADAIEQGYVTEEQAEQMRAMHALHDYIDHEAIVADVLGLSV